MVRAVMAVFTIGFAIFRLPRVMRHPLEDGLSAVVIADDFEGGEDRGAAFGVADQTAGFAAIVVCGCGGDGKETDGGDDG